MVGADIRLGWVAFLDPTNMSRSRYRYKARQWSLDCIGDLSFVGEEKCITKWPKEVSLEG